MGMLPSMGPRNTAQLYSAACVIWSGARLEAVLQAHRAVEHQASRGAVPPVGAEIPLPQELHGDGLPLAETRPLIAASGTEDHEGSALYVQLLTRRVQNIEDHMGVRQGSL